LHNTQFFADFGKKTRITKPKSAKKSYFFVPSKCQKKTKEILFITILSFYVIQKGNEFFKSAEEIGDSEF
jgi:hypothetical protein